MNIFKPVLSILPPPQLALWHELDATPKDFMLYDGTALNEKTRGSFFAETLDNAPYGVFDKKSWAYWNLKLGRDPDAPLPERKGLL